MNVPLLDIPKMILKKYKGKLPNGKVLPVISNQKLNAYLKEIADVCGIKKNLTFHTIRHTWATMAYHCEIHPGIISEAMGHSSIKVTETYLKPFQNQRIDQANQEVISFVKEYATVF